MKKHLYILVLSLLTVVLLPKQTFAQLDPNLPRNYSLEDHLLILRHSALLVRMPNPTSKIQALKQAGLFKKAKEVETENTLERKEILLAFRQVYTFGNVYFFEDYNFKKVQEGNLNGILTNKFGEPVPEAILPNEFLVGAFGQTEMQKLDAFVAMDKNFTQLNAPFPFYQRSNYFLSLLTYSKAEIIQKWNEKLNAKYNVWFSEGIWKF